MSSNRKFLPLLVALLAFPAGASAAIPPSRALFGGGAIGPTFSNVDHRDVTWVSARVAQDRKSIKFYADVLYLCGGRNAGIVLTVAEVPLRSSGRFGGSYTIDPATNSGIAGTLTFRGRFTKRGVGSGTLRAAGTQNGAACVTRDVDWQLRSPPSAPHRRGARTGGTYYGTTKQTFPVMFRTDRSGRRLRQATLEFDYGCQNNQQRRLGNEATPGARISRRGTFRATEDYTSVLPGGMTGHWHSEVSGRIRGDRATGTWKLDLRITRDSDNAVVDTCATGPVRFTAAK